MRALLLLFGLAACQQYASLKAKYITSEPDWQHMPAAGPPVDHMADPCTTPRHDDDYYGFSVGRPQGGWSTIRAARSWSRATSRIWARRGTAIIAEIATLSPL
jgi:hypothetical protein